MSAVATGTRQRRETVPFLAGDGKPLHLVRVRGGREPTRGPVLLVHGAGVRSAIFEPPVPVTLVDALVDDGYDVWLENWRASIDVEPCEWTLDDAAVHDHPSAVRTVLAHTGASELKAIVHCQGSTSFAMAAVAGLLPEVTTIVSNAVSLHPVLPKVSQVKIRAATPVIGRLTPYLNPAWGLEAPDATARAIVGLVRLTHRECDNIVCRMVSFTYGTGFPCLWSHANLDAATHDWIAHEFAEVPVSFFRQMVRSVVRGHLVSGDTGGPLPVSVVAGPPRTEARFVLLAGGDNLCFLPESQRRTYRFLDTHAPGRHALHVLPGYGHLDVFLGRHAARDVFPLILKELVA
ncbi:esterase [Egicoccus sp. AB-alg6-2]|uniref:esterase n=1 Tax=Egicoccus sp. AB-alg6-2 TaxID=3242692 RepID=UPI00359DE1FD